MEHDLSSRLAATFSGETARRVAAINRDLMTLQGRRDPDETQRLVEGLVREAHSLKGAADAAGVRSVHLLAGRVEQLFGRVGAGELQLRPSVCEVAFRALDAMVVVARDPDATPDVERLAAELDNLGDGGLPAAAAPAHAPAAQEPAGVFVPAERIESLLRAIDELAAATAASERRLAELGRMAEELREARAPAPAAESKHRVVLLAENSETTRALQKHLLEHAGFEVRAAADGTEAWNLLASGHVDVVVSDILMPGIGGFDLTLMIRADERLRELPVVLITATDSADRRERAAEVGASGFVVKGTPEYEELVETVRALG